MVSVTGNSFDVVQNDERIRRAGILLTNTFASHLVIRGATMTAVQEESLSFCWLQPRSRHPCHLLRKIPRPLPATR
jgi:hypothetical protein